MGKISETIDRILRSGRARQEQLERTNYFDAPPYIHEGLIVQVVDKSTGKVIDEIRGDRQMYDRKSREYGRANYIVQLVDEGHNRVLQSNQPGGARPDTSQSAGDVKESSEYPGDDAIFAAARQFRKDLLALGYVELRGGAFVHGERENAYQPGVSGYTTKVFNMGTPLNPQIVVEDLTDPTRTLTFRGAGYDTPIDVYADATKYARTRTRMRESILQEVGYAPNIDAIRAIIRDHRAEKFQWPDGKSMVVDAMTANALITVYDALGPAGQSKFDRMIARSVGEFRKVVNFAWDKVQLGEALNEAWSRLDYGNGGGDTVRLKLLGNTRMTGDTLDDQQLMTAYGVPRYFKLEELSHWTSVLEAEDISVIPPPGYQAESINEGIDGSQELVMKQISRGGEIDLELMPAEQSSIFEYVIQDPKTKRFWTGATWMEEYEFAVHFTHPTYAEEDLAYLLRQWGIQGEVILVMEKPPVLPLTISEQFTTYEVQPSGFMYGRYVVLVSSGGRPKGFIGSDGALQDQQKWAAQYRTPEDAERDGDNWIRMRESISEYAGQSFSSIELEIPVRTLRGDTVPPGRYVVVYKDENGRLHKNAALRNQGTGATFEGVTFDELKRAYDAGSDVEGQFFHLVNKWGDASRFESVNEQYDDPVAATELRLYIENDGDLYRRQLMPIINNIKRKMKSGRYDHSLAPKLWLYLVDEGAKKYTKEFDAASAKWNLTFPKPLRMAVAQEMADDYRDMIEAGEYGDVMESINEGRGVDMVALYIGDGYLAGATTNVRRGEDIDYWPYEMREGDDWELAYLDDVPPELAQQLEDQGTSDQYFSDGYEAANAAADYAGDLIDSAQEYMESINERDDRAEDEAIRKFVQTPVKYAKHLLRAGWSRDQTIDSMGRNIGPVFGWEANAARKLASSSFEWAMSELEDEGFFGAQQKLPFAESITEAAQGYNVFTTPLDQARAYSEETMAAAGKDLDTEIPDFDPNYTTMQGKKKYVKNIPRIMMPVIEPKDIKKFEASLAKGHIDIFVPEAQTMLQSKFPDRFVSRVEAAEWLTLGFQDGDPHDDVVKAQITRVEASKLKPLQDEIWLTNIIPNIIKFGVAQQGSPVTEATLIISSDHYIIDGHHRTAQAWLGDPSLKMKVLLVPLSIDELLEVARSYGAALGNKPKA